MVSRDQDSAFFAVPPPAFKPSDSRIPVFSQVEKSTNNGTSFASIASLFDIKELEPVQATKPATSNGTYAGTSKSSRTVRAATPPSEADKWGHVQYEELPWKDGFPHAYDWISSHQDTSHMLIAKPKSSAVRDKLKRVLNEPDSDQVDKKPRV